MKAETELIRELISAIHKHEYVKEEPHNIHTTRIESNYTEQGIPDLNICFLGREFWIEFKVGDNKLEPLQISWIRHRRMAGGLVFVITKLDNEYYMIEDNETDAVNYIARTAVTIEQVVNIIFKIIY